MTSEIAILNLEAAVLAADSAVATSRPDGQSSQIFTSANKVFALSRLAPVGILVYGVASFRGIPWEALIKEHRRIHGNEVYDALEDYARHFSEFLLKEVGTYSDIFTDAPHEGSGIAIAGFGKAEWYPSLAEVNIASDSKGNPKADVSTTTLHPASRPALIRPLAQRDMIDQFITGIETGYVDYITDLLDTFLGRGVDAISDILSDAYPSSHKDAIRDSIVSWNQQLTENFLQELIQFRDANYARPIVETAATLPKEQLAEMAEALINITALNRRVSSQEETVGGPVDVAVITKGDGLVWMKRKHYFPPELNAAYLARTYDDRRPRR